MNSTQQNKVQISGTHSQQTSDVSRSRQGRLGQSEKCRKVIYRQIRPRVLVKLEGPAKSSATTMGSLESYLLESTGVSDEGKKDVKDIGDALKAIPRKGGTV